MRHPARIAILVLMSTLLTSCSLDLLYNMSSVFKGNLAVNGGAVAVDTTDLEDQLTEFSTSLPVLDCQDSQVPLSTASFSMEGLGGRWDSLLAPLDEDLLQTLSLAVDNTVRCEAVRDVLSQGLDAGQAAVVIQTRDFLAAIVGALEGRVQDRIHDLVAAFIPMGDESLDGAQALAMALVMNVVEDALSWFPEGRLVTINDLVSAFSNGRDALEADYVDRMASSIGWARSACRTAGLGWLDDAFGAVTAYMLEEGV